MGLVAQFGLSISRFIKRGVAIVSDSHGSTGQRKQEETTDNEADIGSKDVFVGSQ